MPLVIPAWETALTHHPDKAFMRYILRGFREGFLIGFQRLSPLKSANHHMPSAREHPEVVQKYLADKLQKNRFLGPVSPGQIDSLHINRFDVIPRGS